MIDLNLPDAHLGSARDGPWKLIGCKTLLASGVQAGTDCRPSSGCAALTQWLRVCHWQARLWRGPAAVHWHDLFGCSYELELIVEPPASTEDRQVGLERKPQSARASWAEAKLRQYLKHNLEIFQGWSSCALNLNHHDWSSCEFLNLLLFSLFNYKKAEFHFSIRSIKLEDLLWVTL